MKNLPQDVPGFVIEFFQRFFQKSPKFFRIINAVTGVATLIAGAIPVVAWLCSFFGIVVPVQWLEYGDMAVAKVTAAAWVIGKLTVDRSKEQAVITEAKVLPFTVKKEIQQDIKDVSKP